MEPCIIAIAAIPWSNPDLQLVYRSTTDPTVLSRQILAWLLLMAAALSFGRGA